MALLTCPDCNGPVSDQAAACPKCGRPVDAAPPPPVTPATTPATEPMKHDRTGQWIGCGSLIVLALVAVWLVGRNGGESGTRPATPYKLNTPQGQAEYEVCLKRAVDRIDFSGTSRTHVVVPLSAVNELRTCMRDKGFTEKEIQTMVDVLLQR